MRGPRAPRRRRRPARRRAGLEDLRGAVPLPASPEPGDRQRRRQVGRQNAGSRIGAACDGSAATGSRGCLQPNRRCIQPKLPLPAVPPSLTASGAGASPIRSPIRSGGGGAGTGVGEGIRSAAGTRGGGAAGGGAARLATASAPCPGLPISRSRRDRSVVGPTAPVAAPPGGRDTITLVRRICCVVLGVGFRQSGVIGAREEQHLRHAPQRCRR